LFKGKKQEKQEARNARNGIKKQEKLKSFWGGF
jgi:hypothetical protein